MERNRRIGVVGSGTMGSGIAQVLAQAGYPVVLMDALPEALDRAAGTIQKSLERLVKKGTLGSEQVPGILERIIRTTKPEALHPRGATHWSTRTLAKAQGLSHMTVHRIWKQHGLQPHRVETFKLSRDPQFVEKLRDIVGLYLDPPDKALVLSLDEKSQI
jgi:choline dehydrogenase-like flavoprotein